MKCCLSGHYYENLLVIIALHQVHFNITYSLSGLNISRVVHYRYLTRDNSPRVAFENFFTSCIRVAEVLAQSFECLIRALVIMLTSPNPLIEAFLPNRATIEYFVPNANQPKALFIVL
jgi:hypothetical protein